jgi:hypothetical protein
MFNIWVMFLKIAIQRATTQDRVLFSQHELIKFTNKTWKTPDAAGENRCSSHSKFDYLVAKTCCQCLKQKHVAWGNVK